MVFTTMMFLRLCLTISILSINGALSQTCKKDDINQLSDDFSRRINKVKSDITDLTSKISDLDTRLNERITALLNHIRKGAPEICDESLTECPEGFIYQRSLRSCYLFVKEKVTWEEAKSSCSSKGAHMIAIESEKEQKFLERKLKAMGKVWFWLGGIRLEGSGPKGSHVWSEGGCFKSKPLEYTNWFHEEPSYFGVEYCMEISQRSNDGPYQWNDVVCCNKMYYICEINL
ncbi:unnamed protein product [Owenia fusiformis]|uniref:Uncharacterized protein n=1 Tax=Owenia fusiformis TaxID=6347 RepID=A0A8J1TIA2_OWEFU|nr:unnamed protein product [Owenia fusiformis]